jgi:hypothetical protein
VKNEGCPPARRYTEDRWRRYPLEAKKPCSSPWLDEEPLCLPDQVWWERSCGPDERQDESADTDPKRGGADEPLHVWLRAEQALAAIPTILLVGMAGACAFSLLSAGPAWAGFLAGFIPTSALALWAFTERPKRSVGR